MQEVKQKNYKWTLEMHGSGFYFSAIINAFVTDHSCIYVVFILVLFCDFR